MAPLIERSAFVPSRARGVWLPAAHPNVPQYTRCRSAKLQRAAAATNRPRPTDKDDDFVTSVVGKIFGQKVVNDPAPFGLQRIDWSTAVDQYVVMDRDAEPVEGDTPEMQLIRPMLAGTQLEKETLRLAYDAELDGWSPVAFHAKVDGYGAAVVVAVTEGGAIIGGYNPSGYDGYGEKASFGAFLFSWPEGDTSQRPSKLPKVEVAQLAVIDRMEQGPQFGPGDLKILLQPKQEREVRCKLIDYQKMPGNRKTLFSRNEPAVKTQLEQLRVYVRKGGKLKYELEGVRWKSSYTEEGDESGQGPPSGIVSM